MGQNTSNYLDANDFEVPHAFTDSISCMKFAPASPVYSGMGAPILAVASWDGNVSNFLLLKLYYRFNSILLMSKEIKCKQILDPR